MKTFYYELIIWIVIVGCLLGFCENRENGDWFGVVVDIVLLAILLSCAIVLEIFFVRG